MYTNDTRQLDIDIFWQKYFMKNEFKCQTYNASQQHSKGNQTLNIYHDLINVL